jgi:hypothetical protein
VKWPIDYAVSTLRLLRMKPKGRDYQIPRRLYLDARSLEQHGPDARRSAERLRLGLGGGWVSSATLLARYTFARDIIAARGGRRRSVRKAR